MARIGFIVAEDFEDSELRVPLERLAAAGHEIVLIGEQKGKELVGKRGKEKIVPSYGIDDVAEDELDALVIPGGYSPDRLRMNPEMVGLVQDMDAAGKCIAAVCHAGSLLIEAEIVDGRRLTSWPSIKTDLVNAGADWVDEEVVVHQNLITSRRPADLPAFTDAIRSFLERDAELRAGV